MRPILSVVGPHSGCGKTTFVVHLLRHVGGLGCLKVSPAHDIPAQVTSNARIVGADYYLEDPARLDSPGKDTALYLSAGAVHMERLRHRKQGLAVGLAAALACFPPDVPVVVESSSAVQYLQPVAVVLVVRPPLCEMKPATAAILPQVTDLLLNTSKHSPGATETTTQLSREYPALRPPFTWSADLAHEPPPLKFLERLRGLLGRGMV